METNGEYNVIYEAYASFKDYDTMVGYITSMMKIYKERPEHMEMNITNKELQLHLKITKNKFWIKEPYFSIN